MIRPLLDIFNTNLIKKLSMGIDERLMLDMDK